MICSKCGWEFPNECKICTNCGQILVEDGEFINEQNNNSVEYQPNVSCMYNSQYVANSSYIENTQYQPNVQYGENSQYQPNNQYHQEF